MQRLQIQGCLYNSYTDLARRCLQNPISQQLAFFPLRVGTAKPPALIGSDFLISSP